MTIPKKVIIDLTDLTGGLDSGKFFNVASDTLVTLVLNKALKVVQTDSNFDNRLSNLIEEVTRDHGATLVQMDLSIVGLCEQIVYTMRNLLQQTQAYISGVHKFTKVTHYGAQVVFE